MDLIYHNDRLLHQQVHPKAFVEFEAVKFNRHWNLAANAKSALSQLVGQCDFIHCFQQAWAKLGVNLVGGIHNLRCDLVGFHDPDFLAQSRGARRERQAKI